MLIFLLNKSQSNIVYHPFFTPLQEEGDEAYLETYYSENDVGDDRRSSIRNPQSETIFSYDFQNLDSETKSEVPEPHEYAVPDSLCVESEEVEEEDNRLTRLSQ